MINNASGTIKNDHEVLNIYKSSQYKLTYQGLNLP